MCKDGQEYVSKVNKFSTRIPATDVRAKTVLRNLTMSFGSNHSGITLKALLEDPNLQNPPILNSTNKDGKKGDELQYNFGSAFLGPNLWDKTYNDPDFNLEYMDLDEFLQENGIPHADGDLSELSNGETNMQCQSPPHISSPRRLASPPQIASPCSLSPRPLIAINPQSMIQSPSPSVLPATPPPTQVTASRLSPSPPLSPVVPEVPFSVNQQELQLVTFPGQDGFDPRKRAFSEEELKPQPIIKKSKKVFVNEEKKDDKYWTRRNKNNTAAKRSRDARRTKENQIAMRAAFLEKENSVMKAEVEKVKKENIELKKRLAKYEC